MTTGHQSRPTTPQVPEQGNGRGHTREPARHVIVMGPSGSGKSTVAARVAAALGADFVDADDHHPPRNILKMSAGIPLSDEDRRPWLSELAAVLMTTHSSGRSLVLACSALRREYRDTLRSLVPPRSVFVVELCATPEAIRSRTAYRRHFMPTTLLASQLATLEPLGADELGKRVDANQGLDVVVTSVIEAVPSLGAQLREESRKDRQAAPARTSEVPGAA